ncbi:hypothetical protein BU16DRAFT_542206 [Lophium mytilinum]|uniref:Uncharacterized protein n=1 Tax=Lophium mytilinum TaxID=390894 RepID=A0A6A6QJA5_9PEZI|nr:hypothetical protein BU16DRAFT_542206 [Lophium mytilinum]
MPPKRSAPSSSIAPTKSSKRARLDLDLTEDALEEMDKQELISHVLKLQSHIASTSNDTPANASPPGITPEELAAKTSKTRDMMVRGIKSQMKWKPSCKTNSAKFSYEASVTNPAIFHKLFKTPAGWKKKQLQYSPEEFAEFTRCYIEASIRYDTLSIQGKLVTVKWDEEGSVFKVSGNYGKG